MKTRPKAKNVLTFGDLVANFYHTYGKTRGKGMLRLLIKAELVGFHDRNHYVLSRGKGKI